MVQDIIPVKRALISVYDKTGLEEFLKHYDPDKKIDIISSGGTAKAIREMGYSCTDVSKWTGWPESPEGLVKTLHPIIHGGILLEPDNEEHRKYLHMCEIKPIDLVVCNLYPFQKELENPQATSETIRHKIDIGGPTMVRAAAKSYKRVAVLVDWADAEVFEQRDRLPASTLSNRVYLAAVAFHHTSWYEQSISDYFVENAEKIQKFHLNNK